MLHDARAWDVCWDKHAAGVVRQRKLVRLAQHTQRGRCSVCLKVDDHHVVAEWQWVADQGRVLAHHEEAGPECGRQGDGTEARVHAP